MRIKKFVAGTMAEAMGQVRNEFGDDAVILHTKRRTSRGWKRFFFRPKVEVIAALEPAPSKPDYPSHDTEPADNIKARPVISPLVTNQVPQFSTLMKGLDQEIASDGVASVVEVGAVSPPLRHFHQRMIEQEVEETVVESIIRETANSLKGKDSSTVNTALTRKMIRKTLAGLIRTSDIWHDDKRSVIALVGPTGVGKTTTIAKLAANYSLLSGKKVGLITIDTYRVAAVEQLRTYADIISVPISVAYTPKELEDALKHQADKDLVLIDTAGRSHRNQMQVQELKAFLKVANPDEVHLVVSSTTRNRDLDDIVKKFSIVEYDHLIVTKLDESITYGCLVNLSVKTGKPISYLTDGQRVPDDIEAVDALKLSDLILGDGADE